ncbi:MAG: TetR/AcrR family transcriptional regulator [Pseudomonadota bacterium]
MDSEIRPDRKTELLDQLAATAVADRSGPVSLRQFAIKAGVSEPTLRHHFGDRQAVVIAILEYFATQAADFLALSAIADPDLDTAVHGYLDLAMKGVENPLFIQAHSFALVEAIHDPVVARAYLDIIVEPSLKALEARLTASMEANGRSADDIRHTALSLYSSVIFAILHQRLLKGEHARPLDMGAYFDTLRDLLAGGQS